MTGTTITGRVTFDGDTTFEAEFDPSDRWNGYVAAPRFTKQEAEKVVEYLNGSWGSAPVEEHWEWDGDSLLHTHVDDPDDSPVVYEPDPDGTYALWSFGWCWHEVECDNCGGIDRPVFDSHGWFCQPCRDNDGGDQ